MYQRNPYYHRIDEKGQQLPYVDRVIFTVAAANLVPAKAGLGEADLQPRYLNMRDYVPAEERPVLGRERAPVGGGLGFAARALSPDPQRQRRRVAQAHARPVRFPPGALAGDRPEELNQVVYIGLAQAIEQHDHAAVRTVQARVRDQMGGVRPQARQQAAG